MGDISTISHKVLLPKTGQVTSYADYDDGYYQKGNPISPRFVDHGDGTISDRATGLMWIKQTELIIPGASVRADNQIQAALGNWQMETVYAVGDLVKDSDDTFWVNTVAHTSRSGVQASWATETLYTVGTIVEGDDVYKCLVEHTSGTGTMADDRTAHPTWWEYYDQSFSADRTDHPTYWRQTVWTMSADDLIHPAKVADWATAITNCAALDYAGHSDWRCPNANEVLSLVNYGASPAVYSAFIMNQTDMIWSSTTSPHDTANAWAWDGYVGSITSGNPKETTNTYFAFPVRGGI